MIVFQFEKYELSSYAYDYFTIKMSEDICTSYDKIYLI